jgi:hypothetical protein
MAKINRLLNPNPKSQLPSSIHNMLIELCLELIRIFYTTVYMLCICELLLYI